ncbi:UNVERIFIED_CONTAM: hypothetical protein HDU68_006021 [Siphonaria sp. JEL0065]|nr:hypothetical protein HDU68_006021 [Siphonaria sp. JEL0065]
MTAKPAANAKEKDAKKKAPPKKKEAGSALPWPSKQKDTIPPASHSHSTQHTRPKEDLLKKAAIGAKAVMDQQKPKNHQPEYLEDDDDEEVASEDVKPLFTKSSSSKRQPVADFNDPFYNDVQDAPMSLLPKQPQSSTRNVMSERVVSTRIQYQFSDDDESPDNKQQQQHQKLQQRESLLVSPPKTSKHASAKKQLQKQLPPPLQAEESIDPSSQESLSQLESLNSVKSSQQEDEFDQDLDDNDNDENDPDKTMVVDQFDEDVEFEYFQEKGDGKRWNAKSKSNQKKRTVEGLYHFDDDLDKGPINDLKEPESNAEEEDVASDGGESVEEEYKGARTTRGRGRPPKVATAKAKAAPKPKKHAAAKKGLPKKQLGAQGRKKRGAQAEPIDDEDEDQELVDDEEDEQNVVVADFEDNSRLSRKSNQATGKASGKGGKSTQKYLESLMYIVGQTEGFLEDLHTGLAAEIQTKCDENEEIVKSQSAISSFFILPIIQSSYFHKLAYKTEPLAATLRKNELHMCKLFQKSIHDFEATTNKQRELFRECHAELETEFRENKSQGMAMIEKMNGRKQSVVSQTSVMVGKEWAGSRLVKSMREFASNDVDEE